MLYHLLSGLVVYQSLKKDPVIRTLADIEKHALTDNGYVTDHRNSHTDPEELRSLVLDQVHRIMEVGTTYGFQDNLWQCYLTYLIMNDENPLALVSEKRLMKQGSASLLALKDGELLMKLLHYDLQPLVKALDVPALSILTEYHAIQKHERMYHHYISAIVNDLNHKLAQSTTAEEFQACLISFYQQYGVGMFGLNKAFRIRNDADGTPELIPINNLDQVNFDDLVGYEAQKKQVYDNTLAFIEGRAANNVLLYGDAGTGKSTTVKATLNEFYPKGLRLIEIYKHQFKYLSYVISRIKSRNYRFIIFMDDLSFEEFEIEYKYLKAVIEGGFETRPDNILIYATSNRRHLIKENLSDRKDMVEQEDLHHSDTMEEKLSLVDRFGLNILYTRPSFDEYHEIVKKLAAKYRISLPEEDLIRKANTWSVRKGGHTGRIAQQFINSLNPAL